MNTRFKGGEAAHVISTAGARMLLTTTDFLDTDYVALLAEAGVARLPRARPWSSAGKVPDGAVAWSDFLGRAAGGRPGDLGRAGRRASSPTTSARSSSRRAPPGSPRAPCCATRRRCGRSTPGPGVVGLAEGDRYLIINPFFHCFGLNAGILACLITGATIVPHPVFDVPSVMRRVDEERITMLPGAPAIYQTILDHPDLDQFDLSTLRLAVTGAATVPVEMVRRMASELTFKTIVTGYGLTESTGIATMCRHTDDPETIANTAGRPIPDVEVLVVGRRRHGARPGRARRGRSCGATT